MLHLSDIYIYPIKSLGGISLTTSSVTLQGLAYDRRFMLTTPEGMFLTQRKFAQMALLRTAIEGDYLRVWHQDTPQDSMNIPLQPTAFQKQQTVEIWGERCQGSVMLKTINEWFSKILLTDCQLVYMAEDSMRAIGEEFRKEGEIVSFADAYPILIVGQAALDHLNQKLEQPVNIDRFRPNLVFSGGEAHEEDEWAYFKIGEVMFRGTEPCARCNVPNINQQTAAIEKEPNKTLATYRKMANHKIYFGQNACWEKGLSENKHELKVGDEIVLL